MLGRSPGQTCVGRFLVSRGPSRWLYLSWYIVGLPEHALRCGLEGGRGIEPLVLLTYRMCQYLKPLRTPCQHPPYGHALLNFSCAIYKFAASLQSNERNTNVLGFLITSHRSVSALNAEYTHQYRLMITSVLGPPVRGQSSRGTFPKTLRSRAYGPAHQSLC